jgi:ABC-type transport system involved in cytochrome c biogenesis permease subunit
MYAGLKYIPLIVAGLAALCWGFPAAHRLRPPLDIAASLAVLVGVIVTVLGVLLVSIPHFF